MVIYAVENYTLLFLVFQQAIKFFFETHHRANVCTKPGTFKSILIYIKKGCRKYTLISRFVHNMQRGNTRLYAEFLIRDRQFITCRIQLNTKSSDHAFHRDKHDETCGLLFGTTSIALDKHSSYACTRHKLRSSVIWFTLCIQKCNKYMLSFLDLDFFFTIQSKALLSRHYTHIFNVLFNNITTRFVLQLF